jgi:hypothetical protein
VTVVQLPTVDGNGATQVTMRAKTISVANGVCVGTGDASVSCPKFTFKADQITIKTENKILTMEGRGKVVIELQGDSTG